MRIRLLLLVLLIFCVNINGWCGFPFSRVPRVEGTVVDAETGEPIQGAIVGLQWWEGEFHSIEGIEPSPSNKLRLQVTDEKGHYQFKSQVIFTPLGLHGVAIGADHPLYAPDGVTAAGRAPLMGFLKRYERHHAIVFDQRLLRLDQLYRQLKRIPYRSGPALNYFRMAPQLDMKLPCAELLRTYREWAAQVPSHKNDFDWLSKQVKELPPASCK